MKPTDEQIQLIDRLQLLGALIPEDHHGNPSSEMFEDVNSAIKYIDEWKHLLEQPAVTKTSLVMTSLVITLNDNTEITVMKEGTLVDWGDFHNRFDNAQEHDWIHINTGQQETCFRKSDVKRYTLKEGIRM